MIESHPCSTRHCIVRNRANWVVGQQSRPESIEKKRVNKIVLEMVNKVLDIDKCQGTVVGIDVGADCDWPAEKCASPQASFILNLLDNMAKENPNNKGRAE